MIELLKEYEWLVGLLVGFFLNQLAFGLARYWKNRDTVIEFKKHILFCRHHLNYVSEDILKLPYITYHNDRAKEQYLLILKSLKDELKAIDKTSIPASLILEITSLTSNLDFFINSISRTPLKKSSFDKGMEMEVATKSAQEINTSVKKIFKSLDIEYRL